MQLDVAIANEGDVAILLSRVTRLLGNAGLNPVDVCGIVTVCAELAHNIVRYGKYGALQVRVEEDRRGRRIVVEARDHGPGIADVAAALRDHFSTGDSLGLGLPGVRRLMDTLEIQSGSGCGTLVIATRNLGRPRWPSQHFPAADDGGFQSRRQP